MKKNIFLAVTALLITGAGLFVLLRNDSRQAETNVGREKIQVVTTIFPLYDFAKNAGGGKAEVSLLLPPGVEAHSFEPKPSDIAKIEAADIFIYTGEFMEPWAHDIIQSASGKVKIVDASAGVELMQEADHEEHKEDLHNHENAEADEHGQGEEDINHQRENADEPEAGHSHGGADPHIWLDFGNAQIMVENIAQALIDVDVENQNYYSESAQQYKGVLTQLDDSFREVLTQCQSRTIVYGGHYAFGYLAKRYDLEYSAAQGFSPDSEPTAKEMIALVEQIKTQNIGYVFHEELTSPKIAQTLARETNAQTLLLNGAHNLSRQDYEEGATFVSLMEKNLENLSIGLECKK